MLHFQSIFKNLFADKNISDDNLKAFTEDHLQRIVASNGGGNYAVILFDTQNSYNGYFGNIASEDLNMSIRKSLTLSADNLLKSFKKTVSQQEGTIKGLFAVD